LAVLKDRLDTYLIYFIVLGAMATPRLPLTAWLARRTRAALRERLPLLRVGAAKNAHVCLRPNAAAGHARVLWSNEHSN